jgi:transcriptional regulator with XRE-family HTH domain
MPFSAQIDQQIGDRLRVRRIALEMTPQKLAAALGVSVLRVYEWEAGATRIEPDLLPEVAKVLGVSPEYFLAATAPRTRS